MSRSIDRDTFSSKDHPFNEDYFKTGPYAHVSFKRFSQYWWSNRYYAKLVLRHGPGNGRLLEAGCGLGHLLTWLEGKYKVFGSDINAPALREARRNVPSGNFALMSAEDLGAVQDGTFNVVVAKHVVEHLPNPERAVAEMCRVLTKDGLLLLATPNFDSPMRIIKKGNWVGYKDPTHISLKRPVEWINMIQRHGLKVGKVFSDGFWDAPYIPILPSALQKIIFGWPGGLQALMGWSIIPLRMGESLIVIAHKN
jgi:SAM-dependent methyltransferase